MSWEDFRQQLLELGLLSEEEAGRLGVAIQEGGQPASCDALVPLLVDQGKLTAYQAKKVRDGDGKSLVFGNYVILDELGQGGMGTVFKAEHRRMRRIVALKVLSPKVINSPELMERFQREVRAAARLEHPNVVTAYDADEAQATPFFVMQYVDGRDLAAYVRRHGPLPVKQAVDCIVQAARGLQYAHDRGIVHRDIKPGNLLLDKEGVVKLLDLGLARVDSSEAQEADLTSTSVVMGTIDYMAPEQAIATKNADALSDQYSLGLTLWYLLTGRCAYGGDSMVAKLLAHRDSPIPSLTMSRPDVPLSLDFVFQKMVAKLPRNRYPSVAEAAEALVHSLSESGLESARSDPTWNGGATDEPATLAIPMAPGDTSHDVTWIPGATNNHAPSLAPHANESNLSNGPRRVLSWSVVLGILFSGVLASLWMNRPVQPTAGSNVPLPLSATSRTWQPTPEQQAFYDDVAMLPLNDQPRAVREKLRDINPEYDGKGTARSDEGKVTVFDLPGAGISNVWPVRALPDLTNLLCRGVDGKTSKLSDLSPLQGMSLKQLSIQLTSASDLAPLAGMPLERLECFSTRVTDLSPLAGMPLSYLNVANTAVDDLAPLAGAPLTYISCTNTRVADLSPLAGAPLTSLYCRMTHVTDLSPLRGMPLKSITCDDSLVLAHRELLHEIKTLETINGRPAKEVLAESVWRPTAAQQAFFDEVVKLPAEEQVAAVIEKLRDVNPEFSGEFRQSVVNQKVATLSVNSSKIADIWPVRALQSLSQLDCSSPQESLGTLRDLSALSGMKLQRLSCNNQPIVDLRPLAGMPLTQFQCAGTQVTDLDPLTGMQLVHLNCSHTRVENLAPLKGMPLSYLECIETRVSDISPLEGMPLRVLRLNQTDVSDLSPLKGMSLVAFSCPFTNIRDLSPLKDAPLTDLDCRSTAVSDLSPLEGMKLKSLSCTYTQVSDLSPLVGMPLTSLQCLGTQVSNLSPLKGLPLTTLDCSFTQVTDLAPLANLKLTQLLCTNTRITSLSPVRGMPLNHLWCYNTLVSDFEPLVGLPIDQLLTSPLLFHAPEAGLLRSLPASHSTRNWVPVPIAEFWNDFGARRAAVEKFATSTAKLPVDEQAQALRERLSSLQGNEKVVFTPVVREGAIEEVTVTHAGDVTPLRALSKLRRLTISKGSAWLDLSPINNLPVEDLTCDRDQIVRNSRMLAGMPHLKTINGQPVETSLAP